jgi:hypothetical protein
MPSSAAGEILYVTVPPQLLKIVVSHYLAVIIIFMIYLYTVCFSYSFPTKDISDSPVGEHSGKS